MIMACDKKPFVKVATTDPEDIGYVCDMGEFGKCDIINPIGVLESLGRVGEDRECEIFTCGCGVASCDGWESQMVYVGDDNVRWMMRNRYLKNLIDVTWDKAIYEESAIELLAFVSANLDWTADSDLGRIMYDMSRSDFMKMLEAKLNEERSLRNIWDRTIRYYSKRRP